MVNLDYIVQLSRCTHTHARAGRILIGRLYFVSIFHTLDTPSNSMGASNNWRVDCELRVSSSSTPTFPSVSRTSRVENTVLSTSRGINKCKYRKRKRRREKRYLSPPSFFFLFSFPPLSFSFPPFQRTNISIPFLTTHRDRDREIFIRGRVKLNFLHPREYIYICSYRNTFIRRRREKDRLCQRRKGKREREKKKRNGDLCGRVISMCERHVIRGRCIGCEIGP